MILNELIKGLSLTNLTKVIHYNIHPSNIYIKTREQKSPI